MSSTRQVILERLRAQDELRERLEDDLLSRFAWTKKQWKTMNTLLKLTCVAGANQYSGKTTCNTARQSIQLTGLYPTGWYGKRWDHPIEAAACSKTLAKLRNTVIKKMFGTRQELGSGWIPKRAIVVESIVWSKKEKDCIEYAEVRHYGKDGECDGHSKFYAFSFEQGWDSVSGYTLHDIIVSEECSEAFHREMWNRLGVTNGQLVMDMVPLMGETPLYIAYEKDRTKKRQLITITIDDCTHLTPDEIQNAKDEHADDPWKEAVLYGRPVRGQGVIFTKPEKELIMPKHIESWPLFFKTGIGIDIPHTTGAFAAVKAVYDPQADHLHATGAIKFFDTPREVQGARLNDLGGNRIPVFWPHDTKRSENDLGGHSGPIVNHLRRMGCNMWMEPAYLLGPDNKKTNNPREWISDIRDRERSGRISYSPEVRLLLDERLRYSQTKGKIDDDQDDHCLDALGKLVFMLRYFRALSQVVKSMHPGLRDLHARGHSGIVRRREVDFFSIGRQTEGGDTRWTPRK